LGKSLGKTDAGKLEAFIPYYLSTSGNSTMQKHLAHHPKAKGLIPATMREGW
jgi:hypothetical protein